MSVDRLQFLLNRHANDEISSDELIELYELAEARRNEAGIDGFLDPEIGQLLAGLSPLENDAALYASPETVAPVIKMKKTSLWGYVGRAAVFIIATGLIWYVVQKQYNNDHKPVIAYTVTDANTDKYLNLPDGSTVILHAGSQFTYDSLTFHDSRTISLTGEAFFNVKHDGKRPFTVKAGQIVITDIGTSFNVKALPEQEVTVTVKEGKVQVTNPRKESRVIGENEQIVLTGEKHVLVQRQAEVAKVTEWISKGVQFNGETTLADIAKLIEQRFNVSVHFTQAELANKRITTSLKGTEPLEDVLLFICLPTKSVYSISGNEVTITGKGQATDIP